MNTQVHTTDPWGVSIGLSQARDERAGAVDQANPPSFQPLMPQTAVFASGRSVPETSR